MANTVTTQKSGESTAKLATGGYRHMGEFDMGFKATSAPMSQTERYALPVESFEESVEKCISKECETLQEAKRVQNGLSKVIKASEGKSAVRREGTTVYLIRRG